jgi:tartrate dehydrogenase/decarboxylase / D-malate dehydrogenase
MSETQVFKIASIPADGVGKEVVAAGRRVLDILQEQSNGKFAFDWTEFPGAASTTPSTGS